MALGPGTRLGPYEVTAQIGVGGMGEVYRATDTNLKRQVAIKVLPEAVAADAERLARFQREAEVLASLNHPNIAAIHGLERSDGQTALVMELVEGPTLADRIAQGPMPVDEALPIARQIAEALEAAHEQGIIHRDLKPANVKVRPDGMVKVLDFGLAKAVDPGGITSSNQTMSPTITTPAMTQAGLILGTAAYLSPEQAKGKSADRRSDVWAFGAVFYEMLTGRRAFDGDDLSTTLARVIEREPDWDLLPTTMSPVLLSFLKSTLLKDQRQRLRDIGDMRLALEGAFGTSVVHDRPAARSRRRAGILTSTLVAGGALAFAIVAWMNSSTETTVGQLRLGIGLPEGHRLTSVGTNFASPLAIAPDGSHVVYAAVETGEPQLYRRDLNGFEPHAIAGTEGGTSPFFSPDGAWLGFFSNGSLRKVPVGGGTPVAIAAVPTFLGTGVDWGADGWIRFTATSLGSGLWQVSADGGTPERLTTVNDERGEYAHAWPQLLPDGRHVLFSIWGGAGGGAAVLELESQQWRTILPGANGAWYVPTGHLVFEGVNSPGQLHAVSFDPQAIRIAGAPVPLLTDVHVTPRSGRLAASVSANGTLAYVPKSDNPNRLVWVDRQGVRRPVEGLQPATYEYPRVSPDGRRVAFVFANNVWILDLQTGTRFRHSLRVGASSPQWTADGQGVVFSSNRDGAWNLYGKTVGAQGEAEHLVDEPMGHFPMSWTKDGTVLVLEARSPDKGIDIYTWQDGRFTPFLATAFDEQTPKLSPDGRYLAYVSNESGQRQVQVTTFPQGGTIRAISTNGGTEPVWSPDGRELFYRHGPQVMVVKVESDVALTAGPPDVLFEGDFVFNIYQNWDITPDGRRFVMVEELSRPREIRVVPSWFDELRRLARAD